LKLHRSYKTFFQLKFSPLLAKLIGQQTCCYCDGQRCDGKPETFSVSLADVDVATVTTLLDILYTGKTYFATR
jgi:hypothetical protein